MRKRLIAGLVWMIAGILLIALLIGLIQQLLISGTRLMNELGSMTVSDDMENAQTPEPTFFLTEDDFDYDGPIITIEPEELFSIPVEETIEELARENEQK